MKSYLSLVPKYFDAHKRKTRLTIFSVAISVALVTGIFSMVDVFLKFERQQVIKDYGNYHVALMDASPDEKAYIRSRIEVKNSGEWQSLPNGLLKNTSCRIGAIDKEFAENMNIRVVQGKHPVKPQEIMLEQWAVDGLHLGVDVGEKVQITLDNGHKKEFEVSGIYSDFGSTKAAGVPGVLLSIAGANEIKGQTHKIYLVEFKDKVKILKTVEDIKKNLQLPDEQVDLNDRLLAVLGQSNHNAAIGLYTIGGILFCIVLVAGVVMIYNTFNISVMERVRYFGLLRCIGASRAQISKLVKREGLVVTLRAIPLGVLAGVLITFVCSAILKFFNNNLFGDISLFTISLGGIGAGVIIGFVTVFFATLLPARKAARVSPVNAVSGGENIKVSKSRKRGLLTKIFPVETAMGINNAVRKKRTLLLMSCSIAISIIMFLGFNVFVDFMHTSLKTTKPYTPHISLISEKGINQELYSRLLKLNGIERVYGRKLAYVDAAFKATRLTEIYREMVPDIIGRENGLFDPPEKSWLISYDDNQFAWAKRDLIEGEISEQGLNEKQGVLAVSHTLRNNVSLETARLKIGDKVYIQTPAGTKELTVMGILRSVPFSSRELTLTNFITTEKIFEELTGKAYYKAVDVQLKDKSDQETVTALKALLTKEITFLDQRQKNDEMDQTFMTMAVFVYGFVALIAMISILNTINTMNTSIAEKTRYLGVLRAIGMSGKQLNMMVLSEAATYTAIGCLAGTTLGIILQKQLVTNYLASFKVPWSFPLEQVIIIVAVASVMTCFSVFRPLGRIKKRGIAENVNSL